MNIENEQKYDREHGPKVNIIVDNKTVPIHRGNHVSAPDKCPEIA